MSKLETAAQFITQMEEGKYANKINAQRAAGRTRLSEGEKKKAFAAIENHFGADPAAAVPAAKPSKKVAKKAAKKASKKKVTAKPAVATPAEDTPAPAAKKKAKKKASKKKVTRKAAAAAPDVEDQSAAPGTIPISPSQVTSVAGVLQVIDSTVQHSVGILGALQRADEISKSGDISLGIQYVKSSLVGAAQLLRESVVDPLRKAGTQADPEVASRLQAVVASAAEPFTHPLSLPPEQQVQGQMPPSQPPANAVS